MRLPVGSGGSADYSRRAARREAGDQQELAFPAAYVRQGRCRRLPRQRELRAVSLGKMGVSLGGRGEDHSTEQERVQRDRGTVRPPTARPRRRARRVGRG